VADQGVAVTVTMTVAVAATVTVTVAVAVGDAAYSRSTIRVGGEEWGKGK
jgi:hypothetical protein